MDTDLRASESGLGASHRCLSHESDLKPVGTLESRLPGITKASEGPDHAADTNTPTSGPLSARRRTALVARRFGRI